MSSWQRVLICLTVLAVVAMLGPASALAGGPSAGDQQYIDPLGGSNTPSSSHSSNSHSGSSTSSSPTPAPSSSSTSSSTPSLSAASSTSSTASTGATTSSTASGTSAGHADPPGKQLPFTGFNAWAAALLGVLMLGGGTLVRRVTRRA